MLMYGKKQKVLRCGFKSFFHLGVVVEEKILPGEAVQKASKVVFPERSYLALGRQSTTASPISSIG